MGKALKTEEGVRDAAHLVGCLPSLHKSPTPPLVPPKLGVMHACDLNGHGVEARTSKLQEDSRLCVKFYVSIGHKKPWLKANKVEKSLKGIVYMPRMEKNENVDTPISSME